MLSTLRQWLSNNPWQKMAETDRKVFAICVGAAFIFWLILNLSREYTVQREIQLNYAVASERVLAGSLPSTVDADVRGQGWNLLLESLYQPGPLPITIQVEDGGGNNRLTTAELTSQIERNLTSGALNVTRTDFESIQILTTPLAGKRVPIVPNIAVTVAPGFVIVDSLYLSPDSVTVNASNDAVDTIDFWPTRRMSVLNVGGRAEGEAPLEIPPDNITLSRPTSLYSVRTEPFIQRTVRVPITVVNAPAGENFELTPREVEVLVGMPQSAYRRVKPSDFRVEADASTMRDGSYSPAVALRITKQPKLAVNAYLGQRVATYYTIQ